LMEKKGAYWRLYEAQVRRVDAEDGDDVDVLPPNPSSHSVA
jgi:ATP-binding cassette subfamily B protein